MSSTEAENYTESITQTGVESDIYSTEDGTAPECRSTEDSTAETAASASSFQACTIRTKSIWGMKYRFHTPTSPKGNMPLLLYLHNGSGKGDNLSLITDADDFPRYLKEGTLGDCLLMSLFHSYPLRRKDGRMRQMQSWT